MVCRSPIAHTSQRSRIPMPLCHTRRPSVSRTVFGVLLGAVLGVLISGCTSESKAGPSDALPLSVHRAPFHQRSLLTGELVAENAIELSTPNANIWPVPIRWLAEDGIEVKAGDTVVEFDSTQISSNLENLESQVVEARNQLLSLQSEIANDLGQAEFTREQRQADFEKAEIAADVPADTLARQEIERRKLELNKARLELTAAEEQLAAKNLAAERRLAMQHLALEKAEQQAERARRGMELLTLVAPRDGIVLLGNNRQEGRAFQAADSVFPGSVVASLPDLDSLMVEASLFDVDDGKVQAGAGVVTTLDSFPDWPIKGTIREVGSFADQADSRSTRRAFKVRIDLHEIDTERMRPGMSVKVQVVTAPDQAEDEPLLIPRAALKPRGHEILAGLADGSWAAVELGPCNPDVCVLLRGLEEGTALRRAEEPG